MKLNLIFILIALLFVSCKHKEQNVSDKKVQTIGIQSPIQKIDSAKIFLTKNEVLSYLKETKSFEIKEKLNPPFNSFQFNKGIAYEFDGSDESILSVLDENKEFVSKIENQKSLTKTQTINFINFITDKKTYGGPEAACFEPKMGIVLFKEDKPIFVVDICLDCNTLRSSKSIPNASGFSEIGIQKIENLAKELNFYYGNLKFQTDFNANN